MIVDAFLYDGEHELLDVRLAELDPVVDVYVPVVANRTHQGDVAEPVNLGEKVSEYRDPRVVPYMVDLSMFDGRGRGGAGHPDYQVRERHHRDGAMPGAGAAGAKPGDLVLVSDVDEIPRAIDVRRVDRLLHDGDVMVFEQRMHAFALDWLHPQCWLGTMATRLVGHGWRYSPQEMRDLRGQQDVCPQYPQGGWHLSYMNGTAACERKRGRFSHAEHLLVDDHSFDGFRQRGIDVNGVEMRRVAPEGYDWPDGLLDCARTNPEAAWRL